MGFRPALPVDLPAVLDVERAAFDPSSQWGRDSWVGELGGADRLVLVHTDDHGDLDAAATFQVIADTADLHRVLVHPVARRRGLASVLVAEGLAWATAHGAQRMLLEVETDNLAALALYQGLGFAAIASRRDYYGPGRDAVVMERNLEGVA